MAVDEPMAGRIEMQLREACRQLEQRLRAGENCSVENFQSLYPDLWQNPDSALELIFTEFVVRQERGEPQSRDSWYERFPQWRDRLERLFQVGSLIRGETPVPLATFNASLDPLRPPLLKGEQRGARVPPARIGNYEILEEIARGGMGVVYKARHSELNRTVALKVILAGAHAGPEQRARFRQEAQAAARLHHPHIVQIFDIGEEDGLPFLALEYVEGVSLDQWLSSRRSQGTAGMPGQEAAKLLEDLARAVHHAHEHGIIHRDLKPANVLLVSGGVVSGEWSKCGANDCTPLTTHHSPLTAKITDFGLAKCVEEDVHSTARAALDVVTQTGVLIGTPSYMAPEQAAGKTHDITARTDVYALGAILYELLTGRPPFTGSTLAETLDQVRSVEPISPSCLFPSLSRDLETICLKSLQKEPGKRYASARALAEDLARFQSGEPIHARAVGRVERAWRWCRRKPAVAALALGVALLLLGGTAVATTLAIWALSERGRADVNALKALENAKQERAARELADLRFGQAEKAVEEFLDGVENHPRLKEADFYDLRKKLLASAVPFYEDFVRQKPGDASLEAKRGRAYYRLAFIRDELGERATALQHYGQTTAIFRKLVDDHPSVFEYRHELAKCLVALGYVLPDPAEKEAALRQLLDETVPEDFYAKPEYRQQLAKGHGYRAISLFNQKKWAAAEADFHRSLDLYQQLVAEFPKVRDYRRSVGSIRNNLGYFFQEQGELVKAEAEYRQAIAVNAKLASEVPAVSVYRHQLARNHVNLGQLFHMLGQHSDAFTEERQALELRKRLAADFPSIPAYRQDVAESHETLARTHGVLGQLPEAEAQSRQALALDKQLVEEFPKRPEYRSRLAWARSTLSSPLRALGKFSEAEAECREAVVLWKQLIAQFPKRLEYRQSLAATRNNLGITLVLLGKYTDAEAEHGQALAAQQELAAKFPDTIIYREQLARTRNNLGVVLRKLGRYEEAEAEHRHALTLRKQLAEQFPTRPAYRCGVATTQNDLGGVLYDVGKLGEAESECRQALALTAELVAEFPKNREYRYDMRSILNHLALLARNAGELMQARRLFEQAIEHELVACQIAPKARIYKKALGDLYAELGETNLRQRDHAATAEAAARLIKASPDVALDAYTAAKLLGRCVSLAQQDTALPQTKRQELAQAYAEQALTYLREAVRRGYENAAQLKSDPVFVPLQPRPDFQKLVEQLEKR